MRSVIETMEAPAHAPPETAAARRELGDGYDRLRRRVGHMADQVADRVEDSVRTTRRAVRQSARRAEDMAYSTAGEIRRRPFGSVGVAFLAGATVASTITWIALRSGRRSR